LVLVDIIINLMAEPSSSSTKEHTTTGPGKGEKDEGVRGEAVLSAGNVVEVILLNAGDTPLAEGDAGTECLNMIFGTLVGILNDSR